MQPRSAVILLAIAVFTPMPSVEGTQYTVGPEGYCDFHSLVTAIATVNSGDVLYLAENATWTAPTGGFQINGKSIELIGTDGCAQTNPDTVTLNGNGSSSVLEITGSGISVGLWRISITGGGQDTDHGGGIEVRGNVDLTLTESYVSSNSSDLGGGIYFEGQTGSSLFINESSAIQSNAANSGGGIYCTGDVHITFRSGSISVNNAEDGGGIWLGGGCGVVVEDGGIFFGVTFNDASGDGGGIYAEDGSYVLLYPGASVTANESERGGGIFLSGAGTQLSARNAQISANTATGNGGGIFANLDASVSFKGPTDISSLNEGCRLDPPRCALLTGNAAGLGGSGSGGAGYAASGAVLRIQQTFVESSSAPGAASAFHVVGAGTQLALGKSFVTESSGSAAVIRASNQADATISHTTFTRNQDQSGVVNAASGSMSLVNSIFWESTGTVVAASGAGTNPIADCLFVHESTSLAAFGSHLSTEDPLFVDAAAGDYHLQSTSPAIDHCPERGSWLEPFDVDGDPIQDDPATANEFGIADAGGDEIGGIIFTDGFESGNTSAWSSTVG